MEKIEIKENDIKSAINLLNNKRWELEQNKILLKIIQNELFSAFKELIDEQKKSISRENIVIRTEEAFDYFNEVNSINLQSSKTWISSQKQGFKF